MIQNYFKTAWRNLIKNKLVSFINILGLAIGLCACITLYLVGRYEFSFDSFHPDKDRIYRVVGKVEENNGRIFYVEDIPPQAPSVLQKEVQGFDEVAGFYHYRPKITIENQKNEKVNFDCMVDGTSTSGVIITDSKYFSIFRYHWLAGDSITSLNEPFKVVLSEKTAKKYFNVSNWSEVIGKKIIYDDSLIVQVSGIVRDWSENTDFPYREFISFSTIKSSFLKKEMGKNNWQPGKDNLWIWCIAKLRPDVSPDKVLTQMQGTIEKYMKLSQGTKFNLQLQPLEDIHFNINYDHDNIRKAHKPTLLGLMGVAIFLLIIAIINFINLTIAVSIEREKEIVIRKILGSNAKNIIFQFFVETLLAVMVSAVLAVLLTFWVFSIFKEFFPPGITYNLNHNTLLFIVCTIVITVVISCLYPSKILLSFAPVISLKGSPLIQEGIIKWNFKKGLVILQFTLSIIFISTSIIVINQLRFMRYSDFKLNTDAIIIINNWDGMARQMKVFKQRIAQLPGVEKAILQSKPPVGVIIEKQLKYKGKEDIEILVSQQGGDENFVPFYSMKLIAGRNLRHTDSLSELIINKTFASQLGFSVPEDAIGKLLYNGNKAYPIVGIIADYHEGSFHEKIEPLAIGHIPEDEKSVAIKLASNGKSIANVESIMRQIDKIWKEMFPAVAFNYKFFDDIITQMYEKEQKIFKIMITAMLISTTVSSLGLLGLITFTTNIKKKEIGIRKVLGAGFYNIMFYIIKEYIILIFIAMLIASPIAWYFMYNWLQSFAYRITVSWWVFGISGLFALLIALITVSFQTIKAALANPVKSLRTE